MTSLGFIMDGNPQHVMSDSLIRMEFHSILIPIPPEKWNGIGKWNKYVRAMNSR
jgi:hypothetical protein